MSSPEFGGRPSDRSGRWLDGDRERLEEIVDRRIAGRLLAEGSDEELGVGRGREHEAISALTSGRDRVAGRVVMGIPRAQDGDQHPRVEDDQSHSRRRSSR